MNKSELNDKSMQKLRQRAEAAVDDQPTQRVELSSLSIEEIQRLVHELDVHRVELEMQNEELRNTQEELEEALDKYTDLYDYAPVGYLIVENYGLISSANVTAGNVLGESRKDLVGTSMHNYITSDYQDHFYKLRRSAEKGAGVQSCEMMMKRKGGTTFFTRVDCIAVPGDSGSTAFRVSFTDISSLKRMDSV